MELVKSQHELNQCSLVGSSVAVPCSRDGKRLPHYQEQSLKGTFEQGLCGQFIFLYGMII